jgi:hypothetical protein
MSRLNPTTSAARIVARRRLSFDHELTPSSVRLRDEHASLSQILGIVTLLALRRLGFRPVLKAAFAHLGGGAEPRLGPPAAQHRASGIGRHNPLLSRFGFDQAAFGLPASWHEGLLRAMRPSIEVVISLAKAIRDKKLNSRAHGVAKSAKKDGVALKQK